MRTRLRRAAGRAASGIAAWVLLADLGAAAASTALSPAEVRDQRWVREDRPLWRSALALPYDAVQVLVWPLQHGLFWAERNDVPERIERVLGAPFRGTSEADPTS